MSKDTNNDLNSSLFGDEFSNKNSSFKNQTDDSANITWNTIAKPLAYFCGSVLFLAGSFLFIPYAFIENDADGGWLFVIGSAFFWYGDLVEFRNMHVHNRNDCNSNVRTNAESPLVTCENGDANKDSKILLSKANEELFQCVLINKFIFYSLVAEFFLIGSFCFVPALNQLNLGIALFIIANIIFIELKGRVIYLIGVDNDYNNDFVLAKLYKQKLAVFIDMANMIGAVAFIIGNILYLPFKFADLTRQEQNLNAVVWFILGSIFFIVSGALMVYRVYYPPK